MAEHSQSSERIGAQPNRALTGWIALVSTLIVLAYVSNLASPGPPATDILFKYSSAVGALVQYTLIIGAVAFVSRGVPIRALGFCRPRSWWRAGALTIASLLAIWVIGAGLNLFLKAGAEQGLVPDRWDSSRAGAFLANFIVIAVVAPIAEETTYRGLGFAVIGDRSGQISAIGVTALAFGLAHGLVVALPVLTIFGVLLAWLRSRTESIYPPIILHALFNSTALIAAVTFAGSLT